MFLLEFIDVFFELKKKKKGYRNKGKVEYRLITEEERLFHTQTGIKDLKDRDQVWKKSLCVRIGKSFRGK